MVQVLQKGANVSLTKIAPNCNEITIAVKWVKEANDETEFDIDASAFMLADNNKIRGSSRFRGVDTRYSIINKRIITP